MIKVIAASELPSNDTYDNIFILLYQHAPLLEMDGIYVPVRWIGLCKINIEKRNHNIEYLQEQIKQYGDQGIKIKITMNEQEIPIDEII